MSDLNTKIQGWCTTGEFPEEDEFFHSFTTDNGLFRQDEGTCWDFKDEWPFSLSDEYFGALARLVCAFSNTFGGFIIFGVHDARRDGGHNKVKVNFDKFQTALSQIISGDLRLKISSYEGTPGGVDVLLVQPREHGFPPVRFSKKIGKYPEGKIWLRKNYEVVESAPGDFPVLFCRAGSDIAALEPIEIDGSLPPSPAKIKRFVGRVHVMDQLFNWLQNSDEPRTYLYGKGGSGKSTIAFEFARLLKEYGASLKAYRSDNVESVIFLSAKEKSLNSTKPEILDVDPDFSSEEELHRKILLYSRWIIDENHLLSLNLIELRDEIKELFNFTSVLLVIDDIDTLTTKGIDAGSEFLFKTICRANKLSKILYTLRNAPTQSIANSIEVPGLAGDDYTQFVSECAKQFSVSEPPSAFRDTDLAQVSERRPLVIESVIALVRTTGSYKRAVEAFEQHAGEGVRDYVFLREWDSLSGENPSRLLLAALADLDQPINFGDLQTVLQNEPSRVQDAIGAVREMFLTLNQAGDETLYLLAPLTRKFVTSKKNSLTGYSVLRERVKAFKRHIHISSPEVAGRIIAVEKLLPPRLHEHAPARAEEAWRVVFDQSLRPSVTEDPLFRALLGYVAVSIRPAKLTEAREAFTYALKMGYEPEYNYLRAWLNAEKTSGAYDGWCERIADTVISGKKYSEYEKIGMTSRKATSLFVRGKDLIYTDYQDAIKILFDSLALHLRAFRLNCLSANPYTDVSERMARNTALDLLRYTSKREAPWEALEYLAMLANLKDVYLDPIEDGLRESLRNISLLPKRPDLVSRLRQKLRPLPDLMASRDRWLESESSRRCIDLVRSTERELAEKRERSSVV